MYTELDLESLEVGKPIKQSLFTTIKANEDDLETRLDGLEQGASKVTVANYSLVGYISHYSPAELVDIKTFRAPSNFNLLEFVITLIDSPNAFDTLGSPVVSSANGELQLDLKKSIDGGLTFGTIMTTLPAIVDGQSGKGVTSNDGNNTAAVFSDIEIEQDDILRIDVTSLKDVQGTFLITCYGELS